MTQTKIGKIEQAQDNHNSKPAQSKFPLVSHSYSKLPFAAPRSRDLVSKSKHSPSPMYSPQTHQAPTHLMYLDTISDLYKVLIDQNADSTHVLLQLELSASTRGVLLTDLTALLDLVFEPMVGSKVRTQLLGKILVPRGDYEIPADVLLRVLGCLGAPQVYYKQGKQLMLKRFSLLTQRNLLQWTVTILPFFGTELALTLRRELPVLFGLLSFEYLRPYVTTLIIVATANNLGKPASTSNRLGLKSPLRSWHVQLVLDLLERFPLDASLHALLAHFSRLESTLDFRKIIKRDLPNINSGLFEIALPDLDFPAISRLDFQQPLDGPGKNIMDVHSELTVLYKDFERTSKKRKVNLLPRRTDVFDASPAVDQVPMSSINTVQDLIANFEKITFMNPSSVFSKMPARNHRMRCLYVSLVLLSSNSSNQIHKKIASTLTHHILLSDSQPGAYTNFRLESFANYEALSHFAQELHSSLTRDVGPHGNVLFLRNQCRLIPLFYLANGDAAIQAIKRIFACIGRLLTKNDKDVQALILQTMAHLSLHVSKLKPKDSGVGAFHESVFPIVFHLMDCFWSRLMLSTKLSLVSYLNNAISMASEILQPWSGATNLIPHQALMFKLVTSTHPLIVAETLGFIAALKKLKLSEDNIIKSEIKNAFVMDSINFFWRDMAFKQEKGTFNQGMYLHPHFLQKMSGLDFFSNSDLILTKSVGGIVRNPAFAYLCAETVWGLEDTEENLSMRHPGPISESSVNQMQRDEQVTWLDLSYNELKINLLNHLDSMGFTGMGDLLFTSLKPLINQRTKRRNNTRV